MSLNRRRFVGLIAGATAALAGCTGSGPMTVSDTRLAHQEGRVGVFVSLRDADPNEAGPVTVRAELLDGDEEVIAEREEEFEVGGRDEANVVVWFDAVSDADRERVTGARASVVS